MADPISRISSNASYDPAQLADPNGENACATRASAHASPASSASIPADFPGSAPLHKFRATGEVTWDCVADCVSSQGITGAATVGAAGVLAGPAATAAELTGAIVTPIACYFACADLEGLAPAPAFPTTESKEVPDASVYFP
jgi:hypothetical protein